MKFVKDGFKGVVLGAVYHTEFKKGDECPKELERAAVEQGFVRIAQKNTISKGVGLLDEFVPSLGPTSTDAMDATEVVKDA